LEGRQAALDKQLEEEKIAAEKAAEELEAQRLAAAIAAGEAPPAASQSGEEFFMGKEGIDLSPAVLEAEESADGRVRVPKPRRKGLEPKGRPRKGEEGESAPDA
jgi:hypothetical protein